MTRAKVVLVAVMAIPLAGCVLSGKPKAVAAAPAPPQSAPAPPPAEPLSIPQTQVELPPPQTFDSHSLDTAKQVEPAAPEPAKPAAPQASHQQQHPAPPAPKPPEQPQPIPEPTRPPIQEILPADVEKQFQDSAQKHRADTQALLAAARRRRMSAKENRMVADINQFLKQSEQAETNKDMRSADQLAERAFILAKELQSGK